MSTDKYPAILSIIGWHANESPEEIIERKRDDISKAGRTIWLYHSQKASIPDVQKFGEKYPNLIVVFLRGTAFLAGPADAARQMSDDRIR